MDGADGVGSPGAGMTGTGRRDHSAENWAACTVTRRASTTSTAPMTTELRSQIAAAPAVISTPVPATVAAVNTAIARWATVMLMIDQAATPAAASSTCDGPRSPGTASPRAAAIGASAVTDNAVA